MKSRIQSFIVIGLLVIILGIAWISFSTRNQEVTEIFPATINRDCAPWDGAAFTILIPMSDRTTLDISIWQSPEINSSGTFSFPDDTGQVGNALLLHEAGLPDQLRGSVSFKRIDQEQPVEGRFDLATEAGQQFKGQFSAEWENEVVYCG